jgi:hypothetical protein
VFEVPTERWFGLNGLNHFYGWECNLGVDLIKVNSDGTISGNCTQKLYGLNELLNIHDEDFVDNFSPEIKPVICKQLVCACGGETRLKKHKINRNK